MDRKKGYGRPGHNAPRVARLWRLFDTVSARMMLIILFSAGPIAVIGGLQAWNSYRHTLAAPAFRADMAVSRIDLEIRHDVDHVSALLLSVSHMSLDEPGIARTLQLAQSLTGHFYRQMALLDDRGVIQVAVDSGRPLPLPAQVPDDDLPRFSGDVRIRPLVIAGPNPGGYSYIRITVPTAIADSEGNIVRKGFLTAIMPVVWSRHHLQIGDPRLDFIQQDGAIEAWIVGRNHDIAPLCDDCWQPGAPPPQVIRWIRSMPSDLSNTRRTFSVGDAAYAYGPVEGGVAALTVTRRNSAETHALIMFAVWLFVIVALLAFGLAGVAQSANILLVAPLRRLTSSVGLWQSGGGVFDAHASWAMPTEIRRLAHAFTQATRSLTRHEQRLARASVRQELLMKEVHHRVKNNLQIVASLLNLQVSRIRQPEAREEFAQARDRVRALATLHRYLYAEGELFSLSMEHFATELCGQIFQAAGEDRDGRIVLSVSAEKLALEPDQAVPLALIITEIVTNAIKYAFPDGRRGTITVRLNQVDARQARLEIADDGIGLAQGRLRATVDRTGIGMQLIRGFARQLGGTLTIVEEGGTRYILPFPLKGGDAAAAAPG
ncbi:signal transduction histidine kinase [Gluconacetobacter diazotrophicus PA1 5]|uniref:histidine kinase n=1 Tax=Gluconacetobacter diazotrophicus (strain ATCC 49037 / DSM 5601 / CCUG 37298 / CIP 103539 / LMG 7603 / PAl5) TaxID=272568 RepID=A9HHW0_GLUDA|nr:sensor histidine kinase [Gluconacetobacter diazotrophicus]ACI53248.1 signal transduction histidine kinase [Gluconacetobacter diazotrophicus PA1 5]TWB10375.1 two-component sensor histidine kinase [Gluconacetobacter diazotrophicus]CAP55688.1 putative signal transduction histidine kinase [Gluconacetobacter diazotrophicus PA1 5]